MLYKELKIGCANGLKSRSAAMFVQVASRYDSQILIESGNKKVNAKSIMGVLSLGVKQNDSIYVVANGKDEEAAVSALEELVAQV
jgi:phosphotransferase system HPr (HPr) family protein